MKTKQQFIIDTLKPYFLNPDICAYEKYKGACLYKTEDGRKCAVGKHLKDGEWQNRIISADTLFDTYGTEILNTDAKKQNLAINEWQEMQYVHDAIARKFPKEIVISSIEDLESQSKVNLKELHDLVDNLPHLNETNNT